MLLTKTIKVKITNLTIDSYKNKGIECSIGNILELPVEKVAEQSSYKVVVQCDICKKQQKTISITSLNKYYNKGDYICKTCNKNILNKRCCEICGSNHKVTNYNNNNILLCRKHKAHMRKYGKIKRTVNDKNEIRLNKDYLEFDTYDKNGNIRLTYKADLELENFIKENKIHTHKDGYACYKLTDDNGKSKNMRLHRYIMGVHKDDDKSIYVDHINRDKTDNRKENLRLVDAEQNNRNVGMYRHNTSGYKGISYVKDRNKWEVYIHQNNKKIGLGHFTDIERAIKVRELAEIIYFGKDSPRYDELLKKYISDPKIIEYLNKENFN